ncbi:Hypothetical predicted protein [Cloeon dipterum]|uniref:Uncharacterized protein n=1 Tax=Cloeon dipterum TaxID=197152 RepID=A0A8S1E633_9INSE|nr:Hypothetical predicted protein [Cloeon dipterum]
MKGKKSWSVGKRNQKTSATKQEKPTVLLHFTKKPHYEVTLKHVRRVMERFGYGVTYNTDADWDVLWAHDSPFSTVEALTEIKPHQRVNKIPENGHLTIKAEFVKSGAINIPPAFRFPEDKDKFLKYVEENPTTKFVEKNNYHREIYLKAVKDIDFDSEQKFVQKFIDKPLLIDGKKFEFGVYVVITSIHPLRAYRIKEDMIIRYTKIPYYPFNESNVSQYVIKEDSLQYWESPTMQKFLNHSYSIQESFDATLKSVGANPDHVWELVDKSIVSVLLAQEGNIFYSAKYYQNIRNFFELYRFDYIMDEDYKLYALEANMSPNLSSAKNPRNAIIYEQVLNNLFKLVGLEAYVNLPNENSNITQRMVAHKRNIMVFPDVCLHCNDCSDFECKLCATCLNEDLALDLQMAYREYLSKSRASRVFPPRMVTFFLF